MLTTLLLSAGLLACSDASGPDATSNDSSMARGGWRYTTASVSVTPSTASVAVGKTVQLTATPLNRVGSPLDDKTTAWSSSDTTIAKVSSSGLVTGVKAGGATISATIEGKVGKSTVTVTGDATTPPPADTSKPATPVASVGVTPASDTLPVGATLQLSATPRDAAGNPLAGRTVSWASSNVAVATVSPTGLVTALATGSATITATSEGQSGTSTITVQQATGTPTTRPGFYVSPSGSSSGTGSISSPWNLATALAHPTAVQPGDTIWLRGGTYTGRFTSNLRGSTTQPIVVRQYPGERAKIDGQLVVQGSYAAFWGFEIMSSASGPGDVEGVSVHGPGTKLINLLVHDHGGNGMGVWASAPDAEVYGSIIYNNGRQRVIPGFAHGIYAQNSSGTKRIVDNVVFNQFAYGLHIYTETSELRNFAIEGNVAFNNGAPATANGRPDIHVGGGTPASGISVVGNMTYKSVDKVTGVFLGYESTQNQDITVRDNYFKGGFPVLRMLNWSRATVSGNTLVGSGNMVSTQNTGGYSWSSNRQYQDPSSSNWLHNNSVYSFGGWRSASGLGGTDQVTSGRPTGTRIFVRPNRYEPGRGHVVVYNWDRYGSVSVDLSGILAPGDRYEIRNVQAMFGSPVATGTYAGGSVSLSMSAVAPPQPVGGWLVTPPSTGPEFQVFLVTKAP